MSVAGRVASTSIAVVLVVACSTIAPQAPHSAMSGSGEAVTVSEKDNNGQVHLALGATLVIRLEAIPGAGYGWQVVRNDPERLTPVGTPVYEQSGKDLVGAPEKQVFRFKALAAGSIEMELHYVRPWERGVPPTKTYRLVVVVQ